MANQHWFAGDGELSLVCQWMCDRQEPRGCRRMRWIAIKKAQPNVHQTVSTVGWHHDGELFDETTAISRSNLARRSRLVLRYSSMPIDRQRLHMIAFIENCLCSFHIVEMCVNHGGNRTVGVRSQLL